jgi:hypothetical protein
MWMISQARKECDTIVIQRFPEADIQHRMARLLVAKNFKMPSQPPIRR